MFKVNLRRRCPLSVGSYDLPSTRVQGPSASIRSRIEVASPHANLPDPGHYSTSESHAIGSGAPAVRMRGYSERKEVLFDHTQTLSQGPAAYDTQPRPSALKPQLHTLRSRIGK